VINESWAFICGAQRCSTTSLAKYIALSQDVNFLLPVRPEPKIALQDNWEDLFKARGVPGKINLEKSTSYIEYPKVANVVLNNFSNFKFIFILRDPVERCISNYLFSVENGLEKRKLAEAVFSKDSPEYSSISVSPFDYVGRSKYVLYLDRFLRGVDSKNFKILIAERFARDPSYRSEFMSWLGVEFKGADYPHENSAANFLGDDEITVRERLYSEFHEHNKLLSERYNLDISDWEK